MEFLSIVALIFSPLFAFALILSPLFPSDDMKIRRFAKGFASGHFLYTLLFLMFYNPLSTSFSYSKEITVFGSHWLEPLGISATFAVDGLSLIFVTLTSFIVMLALVASKHTITTKHKLYYSMIFLLQTAILGVFCARDMFLFFMFWELELIPMYFLISQWGTDNAKKSAMKFVLYTFFGSIFLLFGMLCLYFCNLDTTLQLTASLNEINVSNSFYPNWFQVMVFTCFLIGFGVKIPIAPLHSWLPDAHVDAPAPVSMILAGVLLKMGAYGLIRFNMELLPEIFVKFAPVLLVLGVINIIYASCIALAQKDIKRVVAYSSIAHMGIVLIGLGTLNLIGLDGAIFQMLAHGIISAGLFMLVGIIYSRTKTRILEYLGGLGQVMPNCMYFATLICLASLGLPLLMGFPGELLAILGVYLSDFNVNLNIIVTSLALIGMILSATYILYIFHKTFCSNINDQHKNIKDIVGYEYFVLLSLSTAIVFFGVFPMQLINIFETSTSIILSLLQV